MPTKLDRIREVKAETDRFMTRLVTLEKQLLKDKKDGVSCFAATRLSAAVKRAALDLKSELSDLRNFGSWRD